MIPCEQKRCPQMLPDVVSSEQQSLVLVKKLLAIAVSSITYLRGLFPEKSYGKKYVGEMKVLILREHSCPGAQQVVNWLQGCFDALQKRYLRMVILSIYCDPDKPQRVTECYQFKIEYTEKGPLLNLQSKTGQSLTKMGRDNNSQKSSMILVRKLYMLMQNLGPLPDDVCLNMKLFYYDEVTPQEYQPPGFKNDESNTMLFEREPVKVNIGEVVTSFHTLGMKMTTEKMRLESHEDDVQFSMNKKLTQSMFEDVVDSEKFQKEASITKENIITDAGIDFSDTQENVLQANRTSKELTSAVKKRTSVEPNARKTRSGRIYENQISELEFPLSQDPQTSAPKKRKVSVPMQH